MLVRFPCKPCVGVLNCLRVRVLRCGVEVAAGSNGECSGGVNFARNCTVLPANASSY